MSLRLETETHVGASAEAVWSRLADWAGQSDWIPMTTVTVLTDRREGLGVRASALSGIQLGRLPLGLLDRFVVTGWTPPGDGAGELEVLHLGPYFTGPGVFRVEPTGPRSSSVSCTEVFDLPGGRPVEAAASLMLPIMRAGLRRSLRSLGRLVEAEAS
ncbi:MAG: hypothetical protein AVDCRST_MAG75-115 [uncultured Propionibacteriaceae bacterium]|uniref:Polyketide cyclase/dehydrase n=1 Tax=uncultured Propionibacteriaceae bacterium TaxID=257457 RepID=A0A6J4MXI9_9ACTN|nr:MAG: hypothetical protein AVDCRST_MAG75-115 [uncultured Propionibacteriaceae bacterium]